MSVNFSAETKMSEVSPTKRFARKPQMQSKNLQYTRPDENVKGGKNKGIVAQYPYFAPDQGYLKKAPKMTKADELYLKKFMQARADAEIVKEEETILAQKRQRAMNKED